MKKTLKKITFLLFLLIAVSPAVSIAQADKAVEVSEATLNEAKKDLWKPVNVDKQKNNIKNGVEFYIKKDECYGKKVRVLKLVNKNNYAVNISYQMSAESAVVNITLPAAVAIEGMCGAIDDNLAKLVINSPVVKTAEDKKNIKDYLRNHLTVTQIK